jgi:hypothetical protein
LRTTGKEWAKSDVQNAKLLVKHFVNVFKPYASEMTEAEDRKFRLALTSLGLAYKSVRPFKVTEIRTAIHELRSTKSPGYDFITGNVLKELPEVGMRAITQLFNSILRTRHFPGLWKVSQIIPILNPENHLKRRNLKAHQPTPRTL